MTSAFRPRAKTPVSDRDATTQAIETTDTLQSVDSLASVSSKMAHISVRGRVVLHRERRLTPAGLGATEVSNERNEPGCSEAQERERFDTEIVGLGLALLIDMHLRTMQPARLSHNRGIL